MFGVRNAMKRELTHIGSSGEARMVDISTKKPTLREAKARATLFARAQLIHLIKKRALPKGDVVSIAKVAGIQAAKRTHELIPMCHPLHLSHIEIDISLQKNSLQ